MYSIRDMKEYGQAILFETELDVTLFALMVHNPPINCDELLGKLGASVAKTTWNRTNDEEDFWSTVLSGPSCVQRFKVELKEEFRTPLPKESHFRNHIWAITSSADKLVRSFSDSGRYSFIRIA